MLDFQHLAHRLPDILQQLAEPFDMNIQRFAAFDAREFDGPQRVALHFLVMADDTGNALQRALMASVHITLINAKSSLLARAERAM